MRAAACGLWSALALCAALAPTQAADPRHPNWPCRQLKVPSLSVAAMWTGPPLDDVGTQWQHPPLAEFIARLAARRTPLAEADKMITEFMARPGEDRQQSA